MAIDQDLLTLAEELISDSDLGIDTSAGSSFRTQFLDPLLTRVGGSPLDVDLETFLVDRLETEIENIDVTPFSAMRDLVIRAFIEMAAPFQREINTVKLVQSLNNFEVMTREELNALIGNYFTELREGFKSRGTVRMFYPSSQSVTVTPVTQFSTGSALNFFPITVQQITSTQMSFQQEGELFYFDVLVEAENPGDSYNIIADEVSTVVGISGVTRVTNKARFTAGFDEETKAEGVARTQNSITIRNLITSRGVAFVIPENFPAIDTLQIIGRGDVEMLRDIVQGPTEISGIPGGISGRDDLDLVLGELIHIGGLTDVYVYQAEPDEEDIDIEDLTDKGFQVFAGKHGETVPGPAVSLFDDEFGFFQKRGVLAGDILRVGEDEFDIANVVSESQLDITPGTLDGGLFNLLYEIVRKVPGFVTVPLYDLVAVDADGTAIIADSGFPVEPIPGSPINEQLLDSLGDPVEKTDNVATENVQLPLLRGTTVEFLDPLTKEPLGQIIPMRDLVLVRTANNFSLNGGLFRGQARHYFRDAVNAWVRRGSTLYELNSIAYRPVEQQVELGNSARIDDTGTQQIILSATVSRPLGNFLGVIARGDRIEFNGSFFMVVSRTYAGGPDETTLTVRESLEDAFGVSPTAVPGAPFETHAGILEVNMSQDPESGLFFVDLQIEEVVALGGDIDEGVTFDSVEGVFSEGWSIKSTQSVLSFSTREKPYFDVTIWVNDTSQLFVSFTAPAIRISYEFAGDLVDIQVFADGDANRIVAEDVLIRHFVPSYVRGTWFIEDLDTGTGKTSIVDYINALDPTDALESSDVINVLYREGATHVVLPVTMTRLTQNRDRTWTGFFSQDTLGSSRIQHFIADEDVIFVAENT